MKHELSLTGISALTAVVVSVWTTLATQALGAITVYRNDFAAWSAVVGSVTTIDFVDDGPLGEIQPDHYAAQGMTLDLLLGGPMGFTLIDNTWPQTPGYFRDNGGLMGWGWAGTHLVYEFSEPIHEFAVGPVRYGGNGAHYYFYLGDVLLLSYMDQNFAEFGTTGFVTDFAFDRFSSFANSVDDIYFPTIPAPSTAILLLLSAGARRRRIR
jgi:hypothetical protein